MELNQDDWQEILKNFELTSDFDYGSEPVNWELSLFFFHHDQILDFRAIQRNTGRLLRLFKDKNSG